MALSLNHIRLKKKKGKPESEYENTAYQENESSSSTGQDNYYEDLSSSVDLQNLEKKHKAQPNEYSKWCKENDSTYVNQDAFKDLAKSNDETRLPIAASPKSTVAYTWKIAAIVCVLLFVVSGIALIAVTVYFQSKDSPCDGLGCLNNGTCSVYEDKLSCTCLKGYTGPRCKVTPCDHMRCDNFGTCYLEDLEPRCACRPGYSGTNCSATPCDSAPCLHGGSCTFIDNVPTANCSCVAGFSGLACEITPCYRDPCLNDGTCRFTLNSSKPLCTCINGFSGDLCEVTPCTSLPCGIHGACSVIGSSFKCNCVDGYTGSNCSDMHCSAEPTEYSSCMFEQDLYDYGDWIQNTVTGPGKSYFTVNSNNYVRFISRRTQLDMQKCVSFEYSMSSIYSYPNLNVMENTVNRWTAYYTISWNFVQYVLAYTVLVPKDRL